MVGTLTDPDLEYQVLGTALRFSLLSPPPSCFTVPLLATVAGAASIRAGLVPVARRLHLDGLLEATGGVLALYLISLEGTTRYGYDTFVQRLEILTKRREIATVCRDYLDGLACEETVPSMGQFQERVEACLHGRAHALRREGDDGPCGDIPHVAV